MNMAKNELAKGISIHAPVKGATPFVALDVDDFIISIHAPVKGATFGFVSCAVVIIYFNPRTREGCDIAVGTALTILYKFQSTHP